ncbi:hypothetical protein NQ317_004702 [Molorchus minor]|uniref:DUF4817 domain-containing protein n=1 Tax=Molorchus minor TaxID=1323400 RepID=A0ABQ9ISY8_9CUCU|nr:hypothetical protein NQ317_004702 [Molorchus minor]
MENFSHRELADIHFIYGFCNGNAVAAVREYGRRFPQRRVPERRIFVRVHRNLMENGSFRRLRGQGRPVGNYNNELVLDQIQENPQINIRTLSRNMHIPRTTVIKLVGRMLQIQGLHPFHYQRVHDLKPEDYPARIDFCNWVLNNGRTLRRILWSDESTFTRDGVFNMHNIHFWANENPRVVRRTNFQNRFSINLWAGIVGDQIIGPIELPIRLNAANYLFFLQNQLVELMDDVPSCTLQK